MIFSAKWDDRIPESDAEKIIETATVLGYSDSEKDCYWTCYQLDDKYYIGLNDEPNIWDADKSDIDDYNHNPQG